MSYDGSKRHNSNCMKNNKLLKLFPLSLTRRELDDKFHRIVVGFSYRKGIYSGKFMGTEREKERQLQVNQKGLLLVYLF